MDPRAEKRLQHLERGDKKASLAAAQARRVIERLQLSRLPAAKAGTTTHNGEQRIKGCLKYSLGSGYRLVTFRQKADLYVLFVGAHDDCDRWLENNREFSPQIAATRCYRLAQRGMPKTASESSSLPSEGEEYETELTSRLSQRDLRKVFCGLT
jgi:hypothetical protein